MADEVKKAEDTKPKTADEVKAAVDEIAAKVDTAKETGDTNLVAEAKKDVQAGVKVMQGAEIKGLSESTGHALLETLRRLDKQLSAVEKTQWWPF